MHGSAGPVAVVVAGAMLTFGIWLGLRRETARGIVPSDPAKAATYYRVRNTLILALLAVVWTAVVASAVLLSR
jgi:hypothetical protein